MRELAAAFVLLIGLAVGALAPTLWPDETGSGVLASATPARSSGIPTLPSWRGRDGGTGYVVCGSNQAWQRPSVAEENAHLAADPRYRDQRVDDASPAASTFAASALLYDGAGNSSRAGLATLTGLWADPKIGGAGCVSAEPQVWLFGYEPTGYLVTNANPIIATLTVREANGYRMVVLTGAAPYALAVFAGTRMLAWFKPVVGPEATASLTRAPQRLPTVPPAATPIGFVIPNMCALTSASQAMRGDDGSLRWVIHCVAVAPETLQSFFSTELRQQGWQSWNAGRATLQSVKGKLRIIVRFDDANVPSGDVVLTEDYDLGEQDITTSPRP